MPRIETDLTGWRKVQRGWLTDIKATMCRLVREKVKIVDRYGYRRGREKGVRLDDHIWSLVGGTGDDLQFLWEMNCIIIRFDGVRPDNHLRIDAMLVRLIAGARDEYSCEQTRWYDDGARENARHSYQTWLASLNADAFHFRKARKALSLGAFIWHSAKASPLVIDESKPLRDTMEDA